jgi:hypothetical protein
MAESRAIVVIDDIDANHASDLIWPLFGSFVNAIQ